MIELFHLAGTHPVVALPLFFLGFAVIATTLHCLYNLYLHPLRHYPGPTLWAATSVPYTLAFLSGHVSERIAELHAQHGDIVRVAPSRLSYTDPSAWRDIRGHRKAGESENTKEAEFYASSRNNVLGAPRDDHTRFRRVLAHGFSAKAMHLQEPLITRYVDLLIARLRDLVSSKAKSDPNSHPSVKDGERDDGAVNREAVDIVSFFNFTTFDIIGDLSFGSPFGCLETMTLHPWVSSIFDSVADFSLVVTLRRNAPLLLSTLRMVFPNWIGRAQADQAAYAAAQVSKRLALDTERHDFIDAMTFTSTSNSEKGMSREEIIENARIMVLAGSETTATALSAAVYLLCCDSRVKQALTKEVREAFSDETEIDFHGVQRLKYIGAVLDESMRILPPVPGNFPRVAQKGGVVICGKFVPEGVSFLSLCLFSSILLYFFFPFPPSIYPSRHHWPSQFNPEFFLSPADTKPLFTDKILIARNKCKDSPRHLALGHVPQSA